MYLLEQPWKASCVIKIQLFRYDEHIIGQSGMYHAWVYTAQLFRFNIHWEPLPGKHWNLFTFTLLPNRSMRIMDIDSLYIKITFTCSAHMMGCWIQELNLFDPRGKRREMYTPAMLPMIHFYNLSIFIIICISSKVVM